LAQSPLTAPSFFAESQPFFALLRLLFRHCDSGQLTLYSAEVNRLTKQEQLVICIIAGLLLLGWAVKAYRTAHQPAQTAEQSKP
jgi:hypothetical protein